MSDDLLSSDTKGPPSGDGQRKPSRGRHRHHRRAKRRANAKVQGQNPSDEKGKLTTPKGRAQVKADSGKPDSSRSKHSKRNDQGASGANGGGNGQSNKAQSRNHYRRRAPLIAAIDLGTNNCRLLIAQAMPTQKRKNVKGDQAAENGPENSFRRTGTFRITDAFSRIVRLGEGLATTGRLSDEAMERTIGALKICANKISKSQPMKLDAVATEACRRAENGPEFLARVKKEVGIDLRVIGGDEEAELALKSCLPLLDPAAQMALVFDIGGGSTEVSVVDIATLKKTLRSGLPVGNNRKQHGRLVLDSVSAPVGVVTFAERASQADNEAIAYADMRAEVRNHFAELAERHDLRTLAQEGKLCVIGTGGTITTLKALHLGLRTYDRSKVDATTLDAVAWAQVIQEIASMPVNQRGNNGCIGQGRADLVLPGCSILEGMMDLWPVARVGVADRGLREGLLVTMMASIQSKSSRRRRGSRGKSRNKAA